MTAFYNEIDPYAAHWLRNLIAGGHIAPGVVDERSIVDLDPDELRRYRQCHFFAGIAGWSRALRLAGVPDDARVWTGSCPCQPFSAAGKQAGIEDERHLWPAFFRLIRECRPGVVIGEQVAGAAGYAWWDIVALDLESEGYAAAAADLGAHSVGAPHIRQRLYWCGMAQSDQGQRGSGWSASIGQGRAQPELAGRGIADGLADSAGAGPLPGAQPRVHRGQEGAGPRHAELERLGAVGGVAASQHPERGPLNLDRQDGRDGPHGGREEAHGIAGARGEVCDLANLQSRGRGQGSKDASRGDEGTGPQGAGRGSADAGGCGVAHADGRNASAEREQRSRQHRQQPQDGGTGFVADPAIQGPQGREQPGQRTDAQREAAERAGETGAWGDIEWLPCSDGKARPVVRSIFPLVDGLPGGGVAIGSAIADAPPEVAEHIFARVGVLRGAGNAIVPPLAAAFIKCVMEARP